MSSGDTSAGSEKPTTGGADARTIHPILEKAKQDGSLSEGTLEKLASPQGIPLAGTAAPVILIVPSRPRRNVKYHVPQQPPRPTRDALGRVRFEGAEHTALGDSALLRFQKGDSGIPAYKVQLVLPNKLRLTYGQIVALGGDFYGIPDEPISDGKTLDDRIHRFVKAYNTLATPGEAASQAMPILEAMQKEIAAVNATLAQGEPASSAYEALGDTLSKQWNVITGGGSVISDWYPLGRYLQLSSINWDHFGEQAIMAYQAGHTQALREAVLVGIGSPPSARRESLSWAYAMDAFACHFLSDVFSAGHIRSPRKQLAATVKGPSGLAGVLTRAMHDEDSHWGVAVHNAAKESWRAYGDKRYFDTVDLANKAIVDGAIQDSVDEVFDAFVNGTYPKPENYRALARVADLEKARERSGAKAAGNISPLFSWDPFRAVVLRRTEVNNLNDYSWTADWWGLSTLADLQSISYDPDPPQDYPQPPTRAPVVSSPVLPHGETGIVVRYAASFVNELYESDPGPWGGFVAVRPIDSYVTLVDVPIGPDKTTSRRIYRQLKNQPYRYAGEIKGNTITKFDDMLA